MLFTLSWTFFKRDAIAVSVSNGLTSVYAGFVVFAYLGHLAHATDQEINDVVREG